MIVRLNIGLKRAEKIGMDHYGVYWLLLNSVSNKGYCGKVIDVRRVESAGGDWDPEPVLWAELEILPGDDSIDRFKKALESLCLVLGEDAIAVAIVSPSIGDGTIIWHPHHDGEKYPFNLEYFAE